jgi:hypothetical protein
MRVAMVTAEYPASRQRPHGGVQAANATLVDALVHADPNLDLHVLHCTRASVSPAAPCDAPVSIHPIRHDGLFGGLPAAGTRRGIEAVLRALRPDVVHVHSVAGFVDGRRWPAALTVHGIREEDARFVGARRRRPWACRRS